MAYSTNPYLPKARAFALQLLIREGLPLSVVANRCGVHRSTIWRWKRKWDRLNHRQLTNENRPTRASGAHFRLTSVTWCILTEHSCPHTHPHSISKEVVWHHLSHILGVTISLSSVKRIFQRHHSYDRAKRRRSYHRSLPRPTVVAPGDLVQTDTVHLYHPLTGKKQYLYTVIDFYSRMAFVKVATRIAPSIAATTVLEAQAAFGFRFKMVQSDNGPEYSRFFELQLRSNGVSTRHSRLHRPNDNAHIERFNRTIQEECTGSYIKTSESLRSVQARLAAYLDFYNTERIHLGIQMRTPKEMLQR